MLNSGPRVGPNPGGTRDPVQVGPGPGPGGTRAGWDPGRVGPGPAGRETVGAGAVGPGPVGSGPVGPGPVFTPFLNTVSSDRNDEYS